MPKLGQKVSLTVVWITTRYPNGVRQTLVGLRTPNGDVIEVPVEKLEGTPKELTCTFCGGSTREVHNCTLNRCNLTLRKV